MKNIPKKCSDCSAWNHCAFNSLSEQELAQLSEFKQPFSLKRGEKLNVQGAVADGAYCIAEGFCKVIWPKTAVAKESIVKIIPPGDMAGYRCLFSDACFRATGVALGDVTGCFISKEMIFKLMEKNTKFNFCMLERMGKDIRFTEKRLHSFCSKNVRERTAETLLYLRELSGPNQNNPSRIQIPLTREELSSWIGTAKETVIRCLSDMKEEGLIELDSQNIILHDISNLKKISGN